MHESTNSLLPYLPSCSSHFTLSVTICLARLRVFAHFATYPTLPKFRYHPCYPIHLYFTRTSLSRWQRLPRSSRNILHKFPSSGTLLATLTTLLRQHFPFRTTSCLAPCSSSYLLHHSQIHLNLARNGSTIPKPFLPSIGAPLVKYLPEHSTPICEFSGSTAHG